MILALSLLYVGTFAANAASTRAEESVLSATANQTPPPPRSKVTLTPGNKVPQWMAKPFSNTVCQGTLFEMLSDDAKKAYNQVLAELAKSNGELSWCTDFWAIGLSMILDENNEESETCDSMLELVQTKIKQKMEKKNVQGLCPKAGENIAIAVEVDSIENIVKNSLPLKYTRIYYKETFCGQTDVECKPFNKVFNLKLWKDHYFMDETHSEKEVSGKIDILDEEYGPLEGCVENSFRINDLLHKDPSRGLVTTSPYGVALSGWNDAMCNFHAQEQCKNGGETFNMEVKGSSETGTDTITKCVCTVASDGVKMAEHSKIPNIVDIRAVYHPFDGFLDIGEIQEKVEYCLPGSPEPESCHVTMLMTAEHMLVKQGPTFDYTGILAIKVKERNGAPEVFEGSLYRLYEIITAHETLKFYGEDKEGDVYFNFQNGKILRRRGDLSFDLFAYVGANGVITSNGLRSLPGKKIAIPVILAEDPLQTMETNSVRRFWMLHDMPTFSERTMAFDIKGADSSQAAAAAAAAAAAGSAQQSTRDVDGDANDSHSLQDLLKEAQAKEEEFAVFTSGIVIKGQGFVKNNKATLQTQWKFNEQTCQIAQ